MTQENPNAGNSNSSNTVTTNNINYQQPVYTQQPAQFTYRKPADYRSLGALVLLEFVTIGIYYYYLMYKITEATNKDMAFSRRSPAGWVLLCFFFPLPCLYIWMYKSGKILEDMVLKSTGRQSTIGSTALLISIFALPFISMMVLQNYLNKAVGGATGVSAESKGVAVCPHCQAIFPDDYTACPNCGAAYKRPFHRTYGFAILMAVLVFIVVILILSIIFAAV